MDKIRKALNGHRPESPSYEPLNPDADGHNGDEPNEPDTRQPASSWLEYTIFLLLGVSMLWAWNMFLAAAPYFQHRFASSAYLLTNFPSYITSVSTITNLVSVTLLTRLQRTASYPQRITISLCLNIVCFTLLAISTSAFRSISPQGYFAFLMVMVFLASLATGLCQNGVFSYVTGFGVPEYTQAIMTGQAIAGVLPCIAQIVSVLSVPEPEPNNLQPRAAQETSKSAFAYFLTAAAVSLLTLFAFFYLVRRHSAPKIQRANDIADDDDIPEGEHHDAPTTTERKEISFWTLFHKLQYLALAVFLTFLVTMFFPIFTQQILSTHPPSAVPRILHPDSFIPLAFLTWNAGDLAGRLLSGLPTLTEILTRHPRFLLLASFLRIVFIPLYLLCNIKGQGATVRSDIFYLLIVQYLFGVTNGVLGSACMMGAGEWVEEEEREAAGGFMGMWLVGGLSVGSLLSFLAA